jgi:PAS domain S-box-containing protein
VIIDDKQKNQGSESPDDEVLYQAIFENTGTFMILIEDDMTISMANIEFVRSSGYALDEIAGRIITRYTVNENRGPKARLLLVEDNVIIPKIAKRC